MVILLVTIIVRMVNKMHKINCVLIEAEYVLLHDILGYVNFDDSESVSMMDLRRKLKAC